MLFCQDTTHRDERDEDRRRNERTRYVLGAIERCERRDTHMHAGEAVASPVEALNESEELAGGAKVRPRFSPLLRYFDGEDQKYDYVECQ